MNKNQILDSNGNQINIGDNVKLLSVSADLFRGLPSSDKSAIEEQINKIMKVQSFDDYNSVELEFTDEHGDIHFIWIESKSLLKQ